MDSRSKDLLFYSNYSDYCKSLIGMLIKQNIRDRFLLICVDRKELNIPKFVDRVPCIYTTTKELFMDEDIQRYIDSKLQTGQQQAEISPFMLGESLNCAQYTFLTPDGNDYDRSADMRNDMMQNQNFVLLDRDDVRISAPIDKEAEQKTATKIDPSLFEKYMNMRKNDDERIKSMINSSNGTARI